MPVPMKTHRGTAKRARVGARGRIKVNHPSSSHLKSIKKSKVRRKARQARTLTGNLARKFRKVLGQG